MALAGSPQHSGFGWVGSHNREPVREIKIIIALESTGGGFSTLGRIPNVRISNSISALTLL